MMLLKCNTFKRAEIRDACWCGSEGLSLGQYCSLFPKHY